MGQWCNGGCDAAVEPWAVSDPFGRRVRAAGCLQAVVRDDASGWQEDFYQNCGAMTDGMAMGQLAREWPEAPGDLGQQDGGEPRLLVRAGSFVGSSTRSGWLHRWTARRASD